MLKKNSIINSIYYSDYPPTNDNLLWLKQTGEALSLHFYSNGKWLPITAGTLSEKETINKTGEEAIEFRTEGNAVYMSLGN